MDECKINSLQREFLLKNGFVIVPDITYKQMFELYENVTYPIITTDSIIDSFYHIFGEILNVCEIENSKRLTVFSEKLYKAVEKKYEKNKSDYFELLKYSAIPYKIMNEKSVLHSDIKDMSLIHISDPDSLNKLLLFYNKSKVDLTQYKVRGIYDSERLKKYFWAMTFYSLNTFFIEKDNHLKDSIRLAELFSEERELSEKYNNINDFYKFLIGNEDDLTLKEYIDEFKDESNILKNKDIEYIRNKLRKYRNPSITDTEKKIVIENYVFKTEEKGLRLFGKKYNPESEMFLKMFNLYKKHPEAMDVMIRLGNTQAEKIYSKKENNQYVKNIRKLEIKEYPENSISYKITDLIKTGFKIDKRSQKVFKSQLYEKKILNSSLINWAFFKHLFVLQTKSVHVTHGDHFNNKFHGIVEPFPDFYKKLDNIVQELIDYLIEKKFHISETGFSRIDKSFADEYIYSMCGDLNIEMESEVNPEFYILKYFKHFLKKIYDISEKQLGNVILTKEENYILHKYHNILRNCHMNLYNAPAEDEVPKCVDYFYNPTKDGKKEIFHSGIGRPSIMYLIYRYNDKDYLTEGGVIPFYDFISENRLSDSEWKNLLDSASRPELKEWQKDIFIK